MNFHAGVRFGVRAASLPARDSDLLLRLGGKTSPKNRGTAALPSEDTMNARITKSIAAIAAVVTTISLFAAVASLADNDRAQAYAAKSVPSALAANTR